MVRKEVINLKKSSFESGKVAVKKSLLYGEENFNNFVQLSFDEILKKMQEYDFKESIDTSYLQYEGFYLIERILNVHFSKVYWDIFRFTSKNNKILFDSYYLKYQIQNLMTYIRCKISDEKNIEGYLVGDKSKKLKYLKAIEMPIEDGIIYISKKLKLDHDKIIEIYSKGLFQLENYLYKIYYERLISYKFKYNGRDERGFFTFVKSHIDFLNARTYLKLKAEKDKSLDFEEIFVEGGKHDLAFFKTLNDLSLEENKKTLHNIFCDSKCDINKTTEHLDKKLKEFESKKSKYLNGVKFGSPFYLLKYLFDVEREIDRLRILLKCKHMNLEEEETLKLIA